MSGATEKIAPRVALFAEIGEAIAVTSGPEDDVPRWVAETVERGSTEALVLASGLSQVVASEFASIAARSGDHELLLAAGRAVREGAKLDAASHGVLINAIVADAVAGGNEGWDSWLTLVRLPAVRQPDDLVHALASFPPEYQKVGQALVDLRWRSRADLESNPATLLEVLRLDRLPRLSRRLPRASSDLRALWADDGFDEAIGGAAEIVVGVVDEAVDLVIAQLRSSPLVLHRRLEGLLKSRGFTARVSQALAEQRNGIARGFAQMMDFDRDAPKKLLEHLASRPHSPLEHAQRVRLDELADFVETLNLNDASTWVGRRREQRLPEVVNLVAVLGGFDLRVIAAEAAVVLERVAACGKHAPFFALFDGASSRALDRWDDVADPVLAVGLLIDMLYWGRGSALVAANALWGAPVAEFAAPLLRDALPELESSTEHQRIAALALASLSSVIEIPEPGVWADDENPVLRSVVAKWCNRTVDGRVNAQLSQFLEDPDGNVRETALRSIFKSDAVDRMDVLSRAAESADPGWMCLSCRTVNPPGTSACEKKKCYRAAPKPAEDARRMLDGTYKSYN